LKHDQLSAADIYRKLVAKALASANPNTYQQVVATIDVVRRLMQANGQAKEYTRWLTELCATHRNKRKFMEKLGSLAGPGLSKQR
jgi:uncharacterized Zn finger protein